MDFESDKANMPSTMIQMGASVQNDTSIPQSKSTEVEPKSESKRVKKMDTDRIRVSKACDNCARRKVKCDGNVPCMQCLLRGRGCEARKLSRRKRGPASIQTKCEKLWSCPLPENQSEKPFQSGVNVMPCQLDRLLGHSETRSAADTAHLPDAVRVNQSEWDTCFKNFCRNAHPQYPFLDLPTVRSRYNGVSKLLPLLSSTDCTNFEQRAELSQVLICLAIGKFCESSYSENTKGCHTSGWGLYSTASGLYDDALKSGEEFSDQLLIAQTMILMAIYLCFVDEPVRAKRLLSIAILKLFSINSRQKDENNSKSVLKDDDLRRALCCSYVLEREIGLQPGDPFLIPDSTVDEILTTGFGSCQLSSGRRDIENVPIPHLERHDDLAINGSATASHIRIMTLHAQATSGIWREFLHDSAAKSGVDPFSIERLERSVQEAHNRVEVQRRKMKKRNGSLGTRDEVLLQIRWWYLKLLVSWSILRKQQALQTFGEKNIDRTKLTTIDLVYTILQALGELSNEYPKFTFPYLHIHITAVEVGLILIMEDALLRECYGSIVLRELEALSQRCFRTSTSARNTRNILHIRQKSRAICSTGTDSEVAGERRSFIPQKLEYSQSLPWTPTSPGKPLVHQGGDQAMLLQEHLSHSTHESNSEDIISTETPLSSNRSIACDSLDAVPGMLTSLDVSECETFQRLNSVIDGSTSSLDYQQSHLSNVFNYGVPEFGLDPAALSALSNAGISPCYDFYGISGHLDLNTDRDAFHER